MARSIDDESQIENTQAPLIEHLAELRTRLMRALMGLVVTIIVCFYFAPEIFQFLSIPLGDELVARGYDREFIFTAVEEVFFTHIKIAVYAGLFFAFPVIAGQLWRFVAPGLYQSEKSAFWPFLVATPILFAMGGALVYFVISPLAFGFFLDYTANASAADQGGAAIDPQLKVSEYLGIVMLLIFAFGLAFQLPVLLTLMARAGIVTADGLSRGRKYAVVGIAVAAAGLTPPDPISQLGLGIPLYFLYEVSILLARGVERKRARREREEGYYEEDEAT